MPPTPDPYLRIRSLAGTPVDEICACRGDTAVILVYRLTPNPFACFSCNGEVSPERIPADARLIDSVADWCRVYGALYGLWLDSGVYEEFGRTQLAAPGSPVNRQGLALSRTLRAFGATYYWWFNENPLPMPCPLCGSECVTVGRHSVCERCLIVNDPSEGL